MIGAGIDSVVGKLVVYKTLDDKTTGAGRTSIDLGNAGAAWNGLWKLSRVYEIRSVKVTAYQNGAVVAERARRGLPCPIASSVSSR